MELAAKVIENIFERSFYMNLVTIENGRPVTDSLTVAETFNRRHADVLRSIVNLECSQEFNERNFASVEYKDAKGESRHKFVMTQDGFSFLVMGYTGKEAARFKEMYILEFGRMREQLSNPYANLSPEVRAIFTVDSKVQKLETRIEEIDSKVETQITLTQGEQRRIQKAVSTKVHEFATDDEHKRLLFPELYRDIKDRWGVPSYRDLLRKDMLSVIKYIDAWQPRRVTAC